MVEEGKLFRRLVSVDESLDRLRTSLSLKAKPEEVDLYDTTGRVAAQDVLSPIDIPPFDKSIMDGYAVRAEDTFGAHEDSPIKLKLMSSIIIGERPSIEVSKGGCASIPTGAPMPIGADSVVEVENTVRKNDVVRIYRSVTPGENVMRKGFDVREGQVIVRRGGPITPKEKGLLAAVGLRRVAVFKRPRVAVFSTGNELISPGYGLKPGQIYDVNSSVLSGLVTRLGGDPLFLGICRDHVTTIRETIEKATATADVVVITGSVSVGAGDVLRKAIEEIRGSAIIVHGIAMRPGKPTLLAVVREKPVFCLPGNPTSALIAFHVFVDPVIRKLSGMPEQRGELTATLKEKVFTERGKRTFVLARISKSNGEVLAHSIPKGSGAVTTFAWADGYIEAPPDTEFIEKGEKVKVTLFRW